MGEDGHLIDKEERGQLGLASRTFEGIEGGRSFDNKSLPSVEDGLGFSMDEAKFMDDIARSPRKTSIQRKQLDGGSSGSGSEKGAASSRRGDNSAGGEGTESAATSPTGGEVTTGAGETEAAAAGAAAAAVSKGKDDKPRRGSNSPKANAFLASLKKRKSSRLSVRRGSTGDITNPTPEKLKKTRPESPRGATLGTRKASPRNQPLDLKPIHISSDDAKHGRRGSQSVVIQPNRFRYVSNASMAVGVLWEEVVVVVGWGGCEERRKRHRGSY